MDGEELTESKLEGATGGVTSSHLPLRNYKCNKCGWTEITAMNITGRPRIKCLEGTMRPAVY